jgi:hypothetical protein
VDTMLEHIADIRCLRFCLSAKALLNYTQQLSTKTINGVAMNAAQLAEAAKFLVHYFGDVHQPLHVGFASDSGGNGVTGTFIAANSVTLHAVWDGNIIARRDNDFGGTKGYTQWLISQANASNAQSQYLAAIPSWTTCQNAQVAGTCPDEWAQEALTVSCTAAYVDTAGSYIVDGFNLQLPYYNRAYPLLDMQLARCGVRLAATLNSIYANSHPTPPVPPARGPTSVTVLVRVELSSVDATFQAALIDDLTSALNLRSARLSVTFVTASAISGMTAVTILIRDDASDAADVPGVILAAKLTTAINDGTSQVYDPNRAASSQLVAGAAGPSAVQDTTPSSTGPAGGDSSSSSSDVSAGAGVGIGFGVGFFLASVLILGGLFWIKPKLKARRQTSRMAGGTEMGAQV